MPNLITENSSNSELIMELIGILQKEASLFETFLGLLEEQQKALVKNDIDWLNKVTEAQREKVAEGGILARQREAVINRLTEISGLEENLTISMLIQSAADNQAAQLESVKDIILDLNEKIGRIQNQNAILINRSRENITKTLELIGKFKVPEGNYQKKGMRRQENAPLALDRRA